MTELSPEIQTQKIPWTILLKRTTLIYQSNQFKFICEYSDVEKRIRIKQETIRKKRF